VITPKRTRYKISTEKRDKTYYSFIYPERMKGWVGLGGWLRNETVYLPEGSHLSQY